MKSEIFVINLIRTSEPAKNFIRDILGATNVTDNQDILLYLWSHNRIKEIASMLRCDPQKSFEKIATNLKREILEKSAPAFKSGKHLLYLLNSEYVHQLLSQILDYSSDIILDNLFDTKKMLDEIYKINSTKVRKLLLSNIQDHASLPSAEITFLYALAVFRNLPEYKIQDEFEIGRLINNHEWIHNTARIKLRNYAIEQGYTRGTDSSWIAVVIDSHLDNTIHEKEVQLDSIAIIHLQERIKWIVQQLREVSEELADSIHNSIPNHSLLTYLKPHIEFYDLKAPAKAWRSFFDDQNITFTKSSNKTLSKNKVFDNILIKTCINIFPKLIRILILFGMKFPSKLSSLWQTQISYNLQFKSIEYKYDTAFPLNREHILEKHILPKYSIQKNVQIIR